MSYKGKLNIPPEISELKGSIPKSEWLKIYKRYYYEANKNQYSKTAIRWRNKSEKNYKRTTACALRYMRKKFNKKKENKFKLLCSTYPQFNFTHCELIGNRWVATGEIKGYSVKTKLCDYHTTITKVGVKKKKFKHIDETIKFLEGIND